MVEVGLSSKSSKGVSRSKASLEVLYGERGIMGTKFPVPGDVFEDAYRIDSILGSGGFARVYRGVELGLDREVALKILRPPVSNTQTDAERDRYLKTLMERFQREAVLLSKLRSPHTVTMYTYGQTTSGLLYMVLEFIDGITLTELSRAGKSLPPERVAKILTQVLQSLREAHSMGMLHRDLKPGNIMLYEHMGERDQAKLLDFGIAKLVDEAGKDSHKEDLTSDGTLIGTPRYMAPEQIQGGEIGPASDIYSLGLVGYELLVGRRAIEGDSSIQIISKQLTPMSFQLPSDCDVPRNLRHLINRMMHKDLSQRFSSAAEVIEALNDPKLLVEDSLEFALAEVDTHVEDLSIEEMAELEEVAKDDRSSRRMAIIVAIVGVVGIILAGAVLANIGTSNESERKPAEIGVAAVGLVNITAKANGQEISAAVFVNGVEKGITPISLPSKEVKESSVVVKYVDPRTQEKLEKEQRVTSPRDIAFEFEPQISNVLEAKVEPAIEDEPKQIADIPEKKKVVVEKAAIAPKKTTKKPSKKTTRKVSKPKPAETKEKKETKSPVSLDELKAKEPAKKEKKKVIALPD